MAKVTEEKRLNMVWNGVAIVNISREFLNSNGAEKHQNVHVEPVSYTHLAESARWSNWPGRYSTAKEMPSNSGSSA